MLFRRTLAAVAMIACAATPLYAQGFAKQLARTGLTQEDVNIMVAQGATLYKNGGASVGADTVWQNTATQAHGLAEITEVDGNCIKIAYRFVTTRQTSMQSVEIRRCLSDGQWKLAG